MKKKESFLRTLRWLIAGATLIILILLGAEAFALVVGLGLFLYATS